MNRMQSSGSRRTRPPMLWSAFVVGVIVSIAGLTVLSRQAIRLSQQQLASEQRERSLQNVRVALWRMDSRLGPYIATLLDSPTVPSSFDQTEDFVHHRFRIHGFRQSPHKSDDAIEPTLSILMPSDLGLVHELTTDEKTDQQIRRSIPIADVASRVGELVPAVPISAASQGLVQNFPRSMQGSSDAMQSTQLSQSRELTSRSQVVQQQVMSNSMVFSGTSDFSPTQLIPLWENEQLLIARVGYRQGRQTLDVAWIDWSELSESLLADVNDLLPGATLAPVLDYDAVDPATALAALPVELKPADLVVVPPSWSATHTALLLAWVAILASLVLTALALSRLITLSERRATFVSAVTHELRTPLTTFRLYSDLLAKGMVADPQDRQEYLSTLRREADRLTHLVDNVLRYSQLERSSAAVQWESVELCEWVERIHGRLENRLAAAEMRLEVEIDGQGKWRTDATAMEQVIFNLVDNATKYAHPHQDPRVHLTVSASESAVLFTVRDHGPGVSSELRSTIFQPFTKSVQRAAETAAGIGLGLALAQRTVLALGGTLEYRDASGGGAEFIVTMRR